ncbi:MAG: Ig-like domain-containing protein [Clostridiales bacterium]|nr:Ig-like domain-containing protein [Clostridiales bacterium]
MKTKGKAFKLLSLIVALSVAVLMTVGYVFAWFLDKKEVEFTINGMSAGSYFDPISGDGTSPEFIEGTTKGPFVISNATHMHNLAALQNTGKFGDTKYYFELKNDIVMTKSDGNTMYMPPIGNDEYPFRGTFNGNGKTIANLVVTTDKDLLGDDYPAHKKPEYEFSRAVGLFGMTYSDGEITSEITNVILDNPLVDVAGTDRNTLYSKDSQPVVGIAVGLVAGKCSSIGVRALGEGAALNVEVKNYSTFNSILGALDEGVDSAVTGGGHDANGGSGASFGASFDVDQLADRLIAINANRKSSTPSRLLPETDTKSDIPVPALGYKVPFTVDNDGEEYVYTGSTAKEITSSDNIGYVMGNQNKISSKKMNFTDNLMQRGDDGTYYLLDKKGNKISPDNNNIPRWFYVQDGGWNNSQYNERFGFAPISQEKYDSLPENVQSILYTTNQTLMRIQAGYVQYEKAPINADSYDSMTWGYHGQISWMGQTYGNGINRDGYIADEDGYWIDVSGKSIDDDGYIFYYDDDNEKRYIPSVSGDNIQIQEDGRLKYSWAEWYFKDADGNDFNVYGDYTLKDGVMVDGDGNEVFIYTAWNEKNTAIPMTGTKVPAYSYTQGVALPNNGLWFKPSTVGTIRFVMFAQKNSEAFCLLKFTRTNADRSNPFYTEGGADITVEKVMQQQLPPYVLFYYEFEVTAEDIAAGNVEYSIMVDNNVPTDPDEDSSSTTNYNGAYFVYLDLGASAAEDTSAIDRTKAVSAVDFIYTGVEIKQGDPSQDAADAKIKVGDFIVKTSGVEANYEASKTSVYFENITTLFKLVFIRLNGDDSAATGNHVSHSGKTLCIAKSDPVPSAAESCDIRATFATYVCPTVKGGSGTASSGGGGGTVTPTPDPTPDTLTLTVGTPVNLTVGGSAQKITVSANLDGTTFSYRSNDEGVARVDENGNVTAVAQGTTTITVTATNGTQTIEKEVTVNVSAGTQSGESEKWILSSETITDNKISHGCLTVTTSDNKEIVSKSLTGSFGTGDDAVSWTNIYYRNTNNQGMVITSSKHVKVTVYALPCDSSGNVQSKEVSATASTGSTATTKVDGVTEGGNFNKNNNTVVIVEAELLADGSVTITASGSRLGIVAVLIEEL